MVSPPDISVLLNFLLFICIVLLECVLSGSADPEITVVSEQISFGTGIHWSHREKALYFADAGGKNVYRYDPSANSTVGVQVGENPSVVIPVKDDPGKYFVTSNLTAFLMEWDNQSPQPSSLIVLFSLEETDHSKYRFGTGKADAANTFFSGTTGRIFDSPDGIENSRNLSGIYNYKKTFNCSVRSFVSFGGVTSINGINWDSDNSVMYYIESADRLISVFDYSTVSTGIYLKRSLFDLSENGINGTGDNLVVPYDVTVDVDNNLWISIYGLGEIIQISDKGALMRSVSLPTTLPTSLTWGGEDYSTLYVTTARASLSDSDLEYQPAAGSLLAITGLGTKGIKGRDYEVKVCDPTHIPLYFLLRK